MRHGDEDIKRQRSAAMEDALRRYVDALTCPACNRLGALMREEVPTSDGLVVTRDCRWCGFHDEKPL